MSQKEAPRPGLVRAAVEGKITNGEGAAALRISVRQFRRLKDAFRRRGVHGLQHGNRGRPSPQRLKAKIRRQIVRLMTTRYAGFTDTHLTEKLRLIEHLPVSRETVRQIRISEKLPAQRRRRAPRHHRRREREARRGALVLVDGSEHRWLEHRHPPFTLMGAVDDATGHLMTLVVRPHEDLHGYVEILRDLLQGPGAPLALYGDRFGALVRNDHHWSLEEQLAGRQRPTHFGQILEELGIGFIAARSPQAKGRIERMWAVLQDRLVSEMRLGRFTTLEHVTTFLPQFMADYNRRFAKAAAATERAWRPAPATFDHILACRYRRTVARDNTVSIPGRWVQLPPRSAGRSWHGRVVEVREQFDGRLCVIYQHQRIVEQLADTPTFTLMPRDQPPRKLAQRYDQPPRPLPPPPKPKRKPLTRGRLTNVRRPKPGAPWTRFKYGAALPGRT